MSTNPTNANQHAAKATKGDVGITANVPTSAPRFNGRARLLSSVRVGITNPRPVTAAKLISMTPAWERVGERGVQKTVNLTAERTAAAIQVYRSLGDPRAAHLIGIVASALEDEDADSPPIAEVLFDAQRADALEELPDLDLICALQSGQGIAPALIAVAERCLRATEEELVAQARKARKLRAFIAEHRNGGDAA